MTNQKNSSLKAAAVLLGVSEDALDAFVNYHNPRPGVRSEEDAVFKLGSEMAVALDTLNPTLAQKWREAHRLTRLSKNDTAVRMS